MAKILTATENLSYEEWLEWRRKGIGGSDASIVCGVNRYKSPLELWLDKTGQIPFGEAGEAAYWGTQLEPFVKREFTKRTGIEIREVKQLLQSEEHPFMLATLDGVCYDPNFGECVFEAKTASVYKAQEWENTIPDEYMLQIQHYMAVTGYPATYIAVLIGGNSFKWKLIERDEELISMLIELESKFWEKVKNGTPPPVDGSDACADFLAKKFSESTKTEIQLPEKAAEIILQYETVSNQISKLTEQKTVAENKLKEMLGNNEIGTIGDIRVAWKSVSQERLNSKLLKTERPEIYSEYASKSTYRRFSITTN